MRPAVAHRGLGQHELPLTCRFDQPIVYWTNFPPRELISTLRFQLARGEAEALTVLLQALGSDDIDWVHRAVKVLGDLGDERAVEPVIATVDRYATLMQGTYEETLETRQPCNPGDLVLSGVQALGKLADARAVPVLITVLDKHDLIVSAAAARALGDVSDPRAVAPLVARLGRVLAERSTVAQHCDIAVESITKALGAIGHPEAVTPLLGLLDHFRPKEIIWVADTLAAIGSAYHPQATEQLSRLLLGNDPRLARQASMWQEEGRARIAIGAALGKLGDRRYVEPLIDALNRKDDATVCAAALALGQLGDLHAVDPLIVVLRGHRNTTVRGYVAQALGRLGDPRAMESLIGALTGVDKQKENDFFRNDLAAALGELGDRRAVLALVTALVESPGESPATVMDALGRLGDPRAVQPLIVYLKRGDRYHGAHAADALGRIGGTAAGAALLTSIRSQPRLRQSTVRALETMLRTNNPPLNTELLHEICELPESLEVQPWTFDDSTLTLSVSPIKTLAATEIDR